MRPVSSTTAVAEEEMSVGVQHQPPLRGTTMIRVPAPGIHDAARDHPIVYDVSGFEVQIEPSH